MNVIVDKVCQIKSSKFNFSRFARVFFSRLGKQRNDSVASKRIMTSAPTFYEVLGVSRDVSAEVIKAQFRALALKVIFTFVNRKKCTMLTVHACSITQTRQQASLTRATSLGFRYKKHTKSWALMRNVDSMTRNLHPFCKRNQTPHKWTLASMIWSTMTCMVITVIHVDVAMCSCNMIILKVNVSPVQAVHYAISWRPLIERSIYFLKCLQNGFALI